jgi:uncharacterized protein (DUF1015 family)
VCPPYDVISPGEQAAFYEKHPHNAIRLELTRSDLNDRSDNDRYRRAASDFAAWQSENVLIREPAPALYAYSHAFTLDGMQRERRGLLAALRVEPWDRRTVRPHERTLSGPKRDRLELMRASRANFSPIWGLYAEAPNATRDLWETISASEPDAEATDGEGVVHRTWVVTDPSLIRSFHSRLSDSPVYIADGHHRYETAMHYEAERCSAEPCSADAAVHFTLAYLVDVADPGLIVLGTHRLIRSPRPLDAEEVARTLDASFDLERGADGPTALLEALQLAGDRPAFAVWAPPLGLSAVARLRDGAVAEAVAADKSEAWRKLDLAALHTLAIDRIYPEGTSELSESGRLLYARAIHDVERAMGAGEIDLAFLVRHTAVQQVTAVADAGDLMPEKSTYFYPKPVTGLAIASLDGDIPTGV